VERLRRELLGRRRAGRGRTAAPAATIAAELSPVLNRRQRENRPGNDAKPSRKELVELLREIEPVIRDARRHPPENSIGLRSPMTDHVSPTKFLCAGGAPQKLLIRFTI
jgi:hypothetical protein